MAGGTATGGGRGLGLSRAGRRRPGDGPRRVDGRAARRQAAAASGSLCAPRAGRSGPAASPGADRLPCRRCVQATTGRRRGEPRGLGGVERTQVRAASARRGVPSGRDVVGRRQREEVVGSGMTIPSLGVPRGGGMARQRRADAGGSRPGAEGPEGAGAPAAATAPEGKLAAVDSFTLGITLRAPPWTTGRPPRVVGVLGGRRGVASVGRGERGAAAESRSSDGGRPGARWHGDGWPGGIRRSAPVSAVVEVIAMTDEDSSYGGRPSTGRVVEPAAALAEQHHAERGAMGPERGAEPRQHLLLTGSDRRVPPVAARSAPICWRWPGGARRTR